MRASRTPTGFTLIELIVVIAISGIIAAVAGIFILRPVQGYNAQVRRAEMVDSAENALRRMQRDLRAALPNSVRITTNNATIDDATCPNGMDTVCVIEMLHTVDGGRYRSGLPNDPLVFDGVDTAFDVIGSLQNAGTSINSSYWVVINNQTAVATATDFNAYNCPAAAGGSSHNCVHVNAAGSGATHVVLGAAFSPTLPLLASPQQRFYIVDTPVTYRCDSGGRTLDRYQNYAISAAQPVSVFAGGSNARVANLIAACRFTYTAGTSERAGVVTLELTVTDPDVNGQSESVRLLHQIHVYNVP